MFASGPELEQDEQQNDDQDQCQKSTTDNHLCVVLSFVSNPVTEALVSRALPLSYPDRGNDRATSTRTDVDTSAMVRVAVRPVIASQSASQPVSQSASQWSQRDMVHCAIVSHQTNAGKAGQHDELAKAQAQSLAG